MCTRPLAGIPNGKTDNGKIKYKIVPYSRAFGLGIPEQSDNPLPYNRGKMVQIPCGQCKECRMAYAKKWSDRCMLELQLHDSAYFLTLTYDDEHLPTNDKGYPTLCKEDFVLFMKRLRKACEPKKLRFYMCGEYGSVLHTRRPHYHAIIFGLELSDLEFNTRTDLGDVLYTSEFISALWKKGMVKIGAVTPQSCSYVARYVMKKQGDDKRIFEKLNIVPEYTNMSRRPGIGKEAYSSEIFDKGYICLATETGGVKIYPPRYYEQFYQIDHKDELDRLKVKRVSKMMDKAISTSLATSKTYLDTFDDRDELNEYKSRIYVRDL